MTRLSLADARYYATYASRLWLLVIKAAAYRVVGKELK